MYLERLRKLQPQVKQVVFGEADYVVNDELASTFQLSDEQMSYVIRTYLEIVLGDRSATEIQAHLEKMPDASRIDIASLSLQIAIRKLWPIQEYLKNVDVLIRRLGGQVPEPIPLPKMAATDEEGTTTTEWEQGTAREMLLKNRQYNEFYLTQKPIRDAEGRLKAPSVANWVADYLHVMGAEGSDTLKRSQYLAKSKNAAQLNEPEKKNILNFLASYDSDTPMHWRVAEGNYILVEVELPDEEKMSRRELQATQQMSELLAYYADIQRNYERQFTEQRAALEAEAGEDSKKLADIMWDALGMQNTERLLAALNLLIERHSLWDVLKTDQRYKGIVSRYIDAHYGTEARNFWNGDITTAIGLAFLWRIMFSDKLAMEEGRAAIVADYFSKKLGQKISPMYLDLQSGKFIFRGIAYKDRQLSFV